MKYLLIVAVLLLGCGGKDSGGSAQAAPGAPTEETNTVSPEDEQTAQEDTNNASEDQTTEDEDELLDEHGNPVYIQQAFNQATYIEKDRKRVLYAKNNIFYEESWPWEHPYGKNPNKYVLAEIDYYHIQNFNREGYVVNGKTQFRTDYYKYDDNGKLECIHHKMWPDDTHPNWWDEHTLPDGTTYPGTCP